MLRLSTRQKSLLAEKLADCANLAVGALVFGQAIGSAFSPRIAAFGLVVWIALTAGAIRLARGDRP